MKNFKLISNVLHDHYISVKDWFMTHKITAFIVVLLIVGVFIYGITCMMRTKYDFKDINEATSAYMDYHNDLRNTKSITIDELAQELCRWNEIRDSVYSCMRREKSDSIHKPSETAVMKLTEDIREVLTRLTDDLEPSYTDVLNLMVNSNILNGDKDLLTKKDLGKEFFASLDTAKIYPDDEYQILARYRSFLMSVENVGVNSRSDLEDYLRIEDKIFRTFLTHLHKYNRISVNDVTKKSEQVIRDIITLSLANRIDKEETMVYLSHRTTRRILQNSRTCIDDIKRLRVTDDKQGQAYLIMAIQPFYEIKPFGMLTMYQTELDEFRKIAKDIPSIANSSNRIKIDKESVLKDIPRQLLRMYISMY